MCLVRKLWLYLEWLNTIFTNYSVFESNKLFWVNRWKIQLKSKYYNNFVKIIIVYTKNQIWNEKREINFR